MTLQQMKERLIKHSIDCVEGALLKDVIAQIEQLELRVSNLSCEVAYLESQLHKGTP